MWVPKSPLSRAGVKRVFSKISEARWEYWFRHERENGLHRMRVDGPFDRAYYDGQQIADWLVAEGIYDQAEFPAAVPQQTWSSAVGA